jgi:SAM-dependent methyltransferase
VTAHLGSLGLEVFGIDLSPGMVAVARRTYPGLRFEQGSMTALDVADGALGGIVAWYSIIHTPPERLPAVFAEFRRVLAPGGHALLAFQAGDERVHLRHAYGHDISLVAYRLPPDRIAELLIRAGFEVQSRCCARRPSPRSSRRPTCWPARGPVMRPASPRRGSPRAGGPAAMPGRRRAGSGVAGGELAVQRGRV